MTTKINGTNTAANPAITGADTDTGLSFGSDTVNINTGGSTRATVDSAGRFLIGTTTGDPYGNRYLTVNSNSGTTAIEVRSATNGDGRIIFTDSTSADSGAYKGQILYDQTNDFMSFNTNGSNERMRIDSSGHVLFNCSSLPSSSSEGAGFEKNGNRAIFFSSSGSFTGSSNIAEFKNANGTVGSINTINSETRFFTTSDYRLKENQVAISDGITRLKTLKPYRFNFKADASTTVDGFFAHEVQSVVPQAISGTKDEVDSDNNPVYQSIDQSKLVPLLTAALQEAITKIETLETKVAALEAK